MGQDQLAEKVGWVVVAVERSAEAELVALP
jgi:hypothetical protein